MKLDLFIWSQLGSVLANIRHLFYCRLSSFQTSATLLLPFTILVCQLDDDSKQNSKESPDVEQAGLTADSALSRAVPNRGNDASPFPSNKIFNPFKILINATSRLTHHYHLCCSTQLPNQNTDLGLKLVRWRLSNSLPQFLTRFAFKHTITKVKFLSKNSILTFSRVFHPKFF